MSNHIYKAHSKKGRVSSSALSILLARYIAGQVPETAWGKFSTLLDSVDASAEERMAFAGFYNDAIREFGADGVKMPREEELEELLEVARA